MKHEGLLRQHVKKGERFEDLECYSILKDGMALAGLTIYDCRLERAA
jgi:hypothetical protein